jgi:hypothetical protein
MTHPHRNCDLTSERGISDMRAAGRTLETGIGRAGRKAAKHKSSCKKSAIAPGEDDEAKRSG